MNPSVRTARAIFDHAHEIDAPADRQSYLDEACADAPELREQVESLLRAYDAAGSFLETPAVPSPDTAAYQPGPDTPGAMPVADAETVAPQPSTDGVLPSEGPGTQIGPYKLVKQLGEGGMGTVYLAEQEQPIRRQVALKIIKPGMDSAAVVARFEVERQALTLMDHAGIARVYDAGATRTGRPYFVMEVVKGVPMTRFCNEKKLAPRERLQLFVTVCQAIQHAHQKGIIHRDIKPSNVLVTVQDGKPLAKVIDFGLAKATEQPLTDQSQLTQAGAIVGTLKYMSPEQADFGTQGVDTRTDVYALGVMLYELLTGTTPLELSKSRSEGFIEVVLRIKEEEPPRPSARVAGLGAALPAIAAQRRTEPARLAKSLRGELDWIVMKALEKERNRRYDSVSGLAQDVERYLDDEPVAACPPSTRYRLGKIYRKHRTLLAAGASVVLFFMLFLMLAIAVLTVGIVMVNSARQEAVTAVQRTRKALNMTDAVNRTLIHNRTRLGDNEKAILVNLVPDYKQFLSELGTSEEARFLAAQTQLRVANIQALIDAPSDAEASYLLAIERYKELAYEFPSVVAYRTELADSNFNLAILLHELKKRPDAEAAYGRAIALHEELAAEFPAERKYRRELAEAHNNLGALLRDQQKFAAAEKAYRQAISLGVPLFAEMPAYRISLAASYHNLGNVVRDQGDAEAALPWYGKATALLEPIRPRPADATLFLRNAYWDRANALGQLGRHAAASQDWQRAIDLDEGADREHLKRFLDASQMEEKLGAQKKPAGKLLFDAAMLHARATASAKTVSEPALEQRYAARTLVLLKQARDAGVFSDPQRVQQLGRDPVFDVLPRDAFLPFVESLKAAKGT